MVELTPGGWILTDRSSNGTFIDGRRVGVLPLTGRVAVHLGDTPDSAAVEFRPVAGRAAPAPGGTTVVHVTSDRLTVDRRPDNDVVLDDLMVSRRHTRLERTPAGWSLVDLGSGNGWSWW